MRKIWKKALTLVLISVMVVAILAPVRAYAAGPSLDLAKEVSFTIGQSYYSVYDSALYGDIARTFDMDCSAYISPATNSPMIPLKYMLAAFGVPNDNIVYDTTGGSLHMVTIILPGLTVQFTADSSIMSINGVKVTMQSLDVPPLPTKCEVTANGKPPVDEFFVPMFALANAFSISLHWDGAIQTATYNPDDAGIDQFVTRLYQNVLGRAPDTGGFNYWRNGLARNTLTGAQATANFFFCSEFVNKNVDDTTFLTLLYNTCLGRAPDNNGLAYWKGMLTTSGWSRKYIVNQFMGSSEFKDICASFGILPGSISVANSELKPRVTAFVQRLYTIFLSRNADASGLNYWTGQIILQKVNPKTIAASYVSSSEFQNRNLSSEDYITALYNGLLGRAPDSAGLAYWVGQINANPSAKQTILNQFLNSSEFAGICASFGV